MRVSCNWLSRHVDLSGIDLDALARRFTMAVAELDGVERVGFGLDNVVIGHVLEVESLEGKKVRLTKVDCGPHGVRPIICGAANVAPGQHVAVALPGQKLGDMEIAIAHVAGIESHGMICSEKELGLSDEHAGILVLEVPASGLALGARLADQFPVEDTILVIDNKSLTHRPDCWGHRGIAREVAALIERPLRSLAADIAFTDARPISLENQDIASCPRYSATTMSGLSVSKSPMWLRLLLSRAGMRPINNLVDATNFAMLDLGNPMHAFDARQIEGGRIVIRRATAGEAFSTLDGQVRTLEASDLVIADAGRAVALAGVMGGLNSEIKDDTTDLVLEVANFDPARVRTTAQRLGLRTESSARFEKSLDPQLVADAARCFLRLVLDLCPNARVTSAFMDTHAPFAAPTVISLSVAYVEQRLGFALGRDRIVNILRGLDFAVSGDADLLSVTVPSYRATKDIGIADDLVEEVGRVFGYDNIPPAAPIVPVSRPDRNAKKKFEARVRDYLAQAVGLDELQTYSFDDDAFMSRLGVTPPERIRLKNAISSDEPCMRTHLAPHLLKALEKNARGFDEVGLFELGRVFLPRYPELPEQPTTLGVLYAATSGESYFARAKAIVLGLSRALERHAPRLIPGGVTLGWAHPVRQARLVIGETTVGYVAELHPQVLHRLDLKHTGMLFELDLDALRASSVAPSGYRALPKFPSVFRDFAVLVPKSLAAGTVGEAIAKGHALIADVGFQSAYAGPGIPEGEKSLAWSVTLRHPDRTLTDAEIRAAEQHIWQALEAVGGRPRA